MLNCSWTQNTSSVIAARVCARGVWRAWHKGLPILTCVCVAAFCTCTCRRKLAVVFPRVYDRFVARRRCRRNTVFCCRYLRPAVPRVRSLYGRYIYIDILYSHNAIYLSRHCYVPSAVAVTRRHLCAFFTRFSWVSSPIGEYIKYHIVPIRALCRRTYRRR